MSYTARATGEILCRATSVRLFGQYHYGTIILLIDWPPRYRGSGEQKNNNRSWNQLVGDVCACDGKASYRRGPFRVAPAAQSPRVLGCVFIYLFIYLSTRSDLVTECQPVNLCILLVMHRICRRWSTEPIVTYALAVCGMRYAVNIF